MMKVLVFGSINIDLIFSVDHIVRGGETISSASLTRSAGGKGANQAAALAKAGLPVFFAGVIGQDGAFLLDLLESYGVDTRHTVRYDGATGQALIQLDKNRQNAIVLFAGGNGAIREDHIDRVLAAFAPGDLVVLQNEIACSGLIMKKAAARGLRIALNPSPYDEKIERLPPGSASLLFVNEVEGGEMAGLPPDAPYPAILDALTRRFPACEIVLTAGAGGAYYGFGPRRAQSAIVETAVVDTTGAGDTFLGFFIAARERGLSVEASLAAACKAASIAVSRFGAMEAIPLACEVFDA